jgi:Zn-dependent peptidase ImmA (M78 family)
VGFLVYDELVEKVYDSKAEIVEMDFNSKAKGLCIGRCIVLNKEIESTNEKNCILAEELGHYLLTVGDISNGKTIDERKQEKIARNYAYETLVSPKAIINAWKQDCKTASEIADCLEVTEEFLGEALEFYRLKYGKSVKYGDYEIILIPYVEVVEK